jgi:hypothetical protein
MDGLQEATSILKKNFNVYFKCISLCYVPISIITFAGLVKKQGSPACKWTSVINLEICLVVTFLLFDVLTNRRSFMFTFFVLNVLIADIVIKFVWLGNSKPLLYSGDNNKNDCSENVSLYTAHISLLMVDLFMFWFILCQAILFYLELMDHLPPPPPPPSPPISQEDEQVNNNNNNNVSFSSYFSSSSASSSSFPSSSSDIVLNQSQHREGRIGAAGGGAAEEGEADEEGDDTDDEIIDFSSMA